MRPWLLFVALLAACGGGAVVTLQTPVPAQAPPPTSAPAPAASTPAPVASAPEIVTPAWTANWQTVLAESWGAPQLGGVIRQEYARCAGELPDPGSGPVEINGVAPQGWSIGAGSASDLKPTPAGLAIDSTQHAPGWGLALLSGLSLDPARPMRLTGVVEVKRDEGAWVGLTLHNGEGNYRETGLAWVGGEQRLLIHAPCYVVNVGAVEPGARKLAIEFFPALGWRMTVDGVERYTEPIDYRNNRLQGTPRPGIWAVNLATEAGKGTGRVRALLGTVTVQQQP